MQNVDTTHWPEQPAEFQRDVFDKVTAGSVTLLKAPAEGRAAELAEKGLENPVVVRIPQVDGDLEFAFGDIGDAVAAADLYKETTGTRLPNVPLEGPYGVWW